MKKKILVVLSGTEKYPNLSRATGVWLGEGSRQEEQGEYVAYVYISPHFVIIPESI